jgi:hypothetical protein
MHRTANKDELITLYVQEPLEVVENLQSIEDEGYMSRWKRFGRITLQTKTIFE